MHSTQQQVKLRFHLMAGAVKVGSYADQAKAEQWLAFYRRMYDNVRLEIEVL